MKKTVFILALLLSTLLNLQAQQVEYKVVTIVESVVSSGLGRSRIISNMGSKDYKTFTAEIMNEKGNNKSKRDDIKSNHFEETKLLNFFNFGSINFSNIAGNDAIITSKMNEMSHQGWELAFALSGVESDGGKQDGHGLYITRLIFKKNK